jgi:hypothetical protein
MGEQTIASAAEPRLSLADNLIYTVALDTKTGVYSLTTIDPATGAVVSSTPYGSAAGDNPLQMVSMISPSGVLYQGTERGLFSATFVHTSVPEIDPRSCGGAFAVLFGSLGLVERRVRRVLGLTRAI